MPRPVFDFADAAASVDAGSDTYACGCEQHVASNGTALAPVAALPTSARCSPLFCDKASSASAHDRAKHENARFLPFLMIENRAPLRKKRRDEITLCVRTNKTSDFSDRQDLEAARGVDTGQRVMTFSCAAESIAWTATVVGGPGPSVSFVVSNRSVVRSVKSESVLAPDFMRCDAACRHRASMDDRLLEHPAASRCPGSISATTASSHRSSDHDCDISAYPDPARRFASSGASGRFDEDGSRLDQGSRASFSSPGTASSGLRRGPRCVLEPAPRVMSLKSSNVLLWLFKYMSEAIL
jgi:hypothetical protein